MFRRACDNYYLYGLKLCLGDDSLSIKCKSAGGGFYSFGYLSLPTLWPVDDVTEGSTQESPMVAF